MDKSEKCKTGRKKSDPKAYVMFESTYRAQKNWQYGSVSTEKREWHACDSVDLKEPRQSPTPSCGTQGSQISDPAFSPTMIMSLVLPVLPAKLQVVSILGTSPPELAAHCPPFPPQCWDLTSRGKGKESVCWTGWWKQACAHRQTFIWSHSLDLII